MKETGQFYLVKNTTGGSVKDVDAKQGIVIGYFSVFGNKDSDGDIIIPGAFKKTLQENGPQSTRPRILHLLQHDTWKPLGKPQVLKEDNHGLYFESKIADTSYGRDTIKLYEAGVLTEHSIGFNVVKREIDESTETTKLIELKLWEGSTVSWGANMEALVTGMKSENKEDILSRLIKKIDAINSAVKGNYTDDTLRQLEIELKQLQQIIISLAEIEKPVQSTSEQIEPKMSASDMLQIIKSQIKL